MSSLGRSALFLDRDGVINVDRHYVYRVVDFVFIDGIFDLARIAVSTDMALVVVTNQAGIGRGMYTETEFHTLTDWMCKQFVQQGAPIEKVYFCPYHSEHGVGHYKADSYDRKPNPGMLLRARDELGIALEHSVLVGDKPSDIVAARAANIGRVVMLAPAQQSVTPQPDFQADSLERISEYLFGQTSPHWKSDQSIRDHQTFSPFGDIR